VTQVTCTQDIDLSPWTNIPP